MKRGEADATPSDVGAAPAAPLTVPVPAGDGRAYRVHVGPGLLGRLGELCVEAAPAHRYAVVADETVADLYGAEAVEALEAAGSGADLHRFPAGEASKTRATWSRLTDALLEAGHGRDSVVVGLGGGVTGDLAGFVAASFLRGVPVVQVPTTVLAMVDAAVGGKTGVNTRRGKNLVGAFHHPRLVVADTETLETLPPAHVTAGLAEAVKGAAIGDPELFARMEERAGRGLTDDAAALARVVHAAVRVKAEVVAEDPRETGRRQVLNFGHTVGHALERLSGYGLLHGRAVAAGMRVEARLGEALGVTRPGTAERLTRLLDRLGDRERPERGVDARSLLEAAAPDKKARAGEVRYVLLERIGRVARTDEGGWSRPLPRSEAVERMDAALRAAVGGTDCGSAAT